MCAELSRHVTSPFQLRIEKKKKRDRKGYKVGEWVVDHDETCPSLSPCMHAKKYPAKLGATFCRDKPSKGIPGVTLPPDEFGQIHKPTASSDNLSSFGKTYKRVYNTRMRPSKTLHRYIRTFVYTTFRKPNRKKTILVIKRRFPYSKHPTSPKQTQELAGTTVARQHHEQYS